jgi:mRNA-degrading endonuclease toxin of MazEF toxin-antitoxin module
VAELSTAYFDRGIVCWATVASGFGHDQGTWPVLVLSRLGILLPPPRAIVVPISSVRPQPRGYPLSWPVPSNWGLASQSWLLIDHLRSLPVARLRDAIAEASRDELEEVLDAVGEPLGATIAPR